jgi:hypothetical protein
LKDDQNKSKLRPEYDGITAACWKRFATTNAETADLLQSDAQRKPKSMKYVLASGSNAPALEPFLDAPASMLGELSESVTGRWSVRAAFQRWSVGTSGTTRLPARFLHGTSNFRKPHIWEVLQ